MVFTICCVFSKAAFRIDKIHSSASTPTSLCACDMLPKWNLHVQACQWKIRQLSVVVIHDLAALQASGHHRLRIRNYAMADDEVFHADHDLR